MLWYVNRKPSSHWTQCPRLDKGLENKTWEARWKEMGLFSLRKTRLSVTLKLAFDSTMQMTAVNSVSTEVRMRVCMCAQSLRCIQFLGIPCHCSLPGSSVHGIFQARILEWVCHFLLQGIFPTQGSNPHPLHLQEDSFPLRHSPLRYSS